MLDSPGTGNGKQPSATSDDAPWLLRVEHLRTWFPIKKGLFRHTVGHVRAVDGVDLAIRAGRTLALVGESGCGKTTVGRSVIRLIEPQQGKVWFDGTELLSLDPEALRPYRRHIQMVFQDPMTSLNPRMRVRDIIAEPLVVQGHPASGQRVRELLEAVGLSADAGDRYPHQFSGGQRQRISIARALAPRPRILIADEPVSALDVSVRAQVLNLISDLVDELNLTLVFVSHDLSVVKHVCDRVAVMNAGQIVETGFTGDVYAAPQHPYTRRLVSAIPTLHRALSGATTTDLLAGAAPDDRLSEATTVDPLTEAPTRDPLSEGPPKGEPR
jgi:peptide/nickel transport system ATP-binding protein